MSLIVILVSARSCKLAFIRQRWRCAFEQKHCWWKCCILEVCAAKRLNSSTKGADGAVEEHLGLVRTLSEWRKSEFVPWPNKVELDWAVPVKVPCHKQTRTEICLASSWEGREVHVLTVGTPKICWAAGTLLWRRQFYDLGEMPGFGEMPGRGE